MVLYSASPLRRALQLAGDLLVVLWVLLWAWLGKGLHDATMRLAAPARTLSSGASDLAGRLTDAGSALDDTPLLGDELGAAFDSAGSAAARVAAAGEAQVAAVGRLADLLGLLLAVVPVAILLLVYLPGRVAFVRRASAGRRLVDAAEDLDLFALRAMTHQPLHRLARISHDPVGDWRRGDPEVVRALAELELRDVGLPVPRTAPPPPTPRSARGT